MSKQQFKVGDRVMVTRDVVGIRCAGKTGTIIQDFFSPEGTNGRYVHLDRPVESVTGRRDWVWAFNFQLKHIREKHPVIVITTDGKTTTATMRKGKKVLKTETATCSDKDTFDFAEGARVAFERLQGRDPFPKEEPKFYNGKMVCIDNDNGTSSFTVGKVYAVKNGQFRFDNGFETIGEYKSIKEINDIFDAKFIPLVED